jgi:hypothetical protein
MADRSPADDLRRAEARISQLEQRLSVYEQVDQLLNVEVTAPPWAAVRRKQNARHRATLCAMLSDLHLDEVVDPGEIGGINAYNRAVAAQRLARFFDQVPWLARQYLANLTYDGCVLFVGGDLISGDIHEELRESNEGTTLETVVHWVPQLASGIRYLADEFGKVHVPWIVGNHGRRTRKPRAKRRARDNYDWMIGQLCRAALADDNRVTWDIPDGIETITAVYDHRYLLYHGEAGGGGGIGGIWPPLMRLRAKKQDRYRSAGVGFDTMVVGHWHQYVHAPGMGLIVNGALKGYDEFGATMGFGAEPPQQALWVSTPERGITFAAPVLVADRKSEGW